MTKSCDPEHREAGQAQEPDSPQTDEKDQKNRARQRMVAALWGLALLVGIGGLTWYFWQPLTGYFDYLLKLVRDREAFKAKIDSYGVWGPVVFIGFQIFQVLISPIPGEAVGVAGGYVLGWFPCLLYSTIGLSIGSWINFFLARLLGRGFVERLIPPQLLAKMTVIMEKQGVIASFVFFVFPGFPKDYYCFVLGLTPIRWRIFMIISSVGRVPGTLMLAIQGDLLAQGHFWSFAILLVASLAFVAPVWLWRERIYSWLYRLDRGRGKLE